MDVQAGKLVSGSDAAGASNAALTAAGRVLRWLRLPLVFFAFIGWLFMPPRPCERWPRETDSQYGDRQW